MQTEHNNKSPVQGKLRHQERKFHKQSKSKPLLEKVPCGCGNDIPLFNRRESVKCYACNSWHHKEDGKWVQEKPIPREVMTIGRMLQEHGIKVRR